jgi:hypothetical protein
VADVKCPGCQSTYYETTGAYDPKRLPNGAMLDLVEPYKSRGWGKYESGHFGGKEVPASEMLCVGCGAPLAPSNRLVVGGGLKIKPTKTFECFECGWKGKTAPALKRHTTLEHIRKHNGGQPDPYVEG